MEAERRRDPVRPDSSASDLGGGGQIDQIHRGDPGAESPDECGPVCTVDELAMLKALEELVSLKSLWAVSLEDQAIILRAAIQSVKSGGYIDESDGFVIAIGPRVPEDIMRQDESGRWYFPVLRHRARLLARHARYDKGRKRRNPTKAPDSDKSAGFRRAVEGIDTDSNSNSLTEEEIQTVEPTVSTPNTAQARECARSIVQGLLWPGIEPVPAPEEKPGRKRGPEWNLLWDAIAEVVGNDGRKSTRSHISKVADDLFFCEHRTPPRMSGSSPPSWLGIS